MNIWRTVYREATAAWRSLRYDLRGPARKGPRTEVIPRVTADAGDAHPEYEAYARRTRRTRAALAVAALSAGGAAATYFGVVGGLSALLAGESALPGALPGVTAERTPTGQPPAGASGRASRPDAHQPSMRPPSATPAESAMPGESSESRPLRPGREPTPTTTRKPPVPTPAPEPTPPCGCPQPTPTASATPTASPSPSPSDPTQPPEPPEWAVAPAS